MSERDELMAEMEEHDRQRSNALAEALRLLPGCRSFATFVITQDGNLAFAISGKGYVDSLVLAQEGSAALQFNLKKFTQKPSESV